MSQKRQGGAAASLVRVNGSCASPWLKTLSSVFAVCALGAVGWFVAFCVGIWKPTMENPKKPTYDSLPQVLGYLSAVRLSFSLHLLRFFSTDMYRYCILG